MTTAPKRQPIPFGKYLLLDRVNIGGMAEVWRAKIFGAGGFEKIVAIKRILPNIAEDEEFISMFIDEAKITVQLTHANIAQIYELANIANSYFISMEYVSGKDLRAVFDRCRKRGEPAPIPLACYAIAHCCEGLDYAHRAKDRQGRDMAIIHRDVSPQNVLISYDGEIKVIDFGIAKAAGKATKTQAGILKGKFGYMSPEQIRGLPLDRRSDVFAIGVCLYEMLTGERLFVGDSDFSVLEKVRKVEVLPPSHFNRKIPDALEKIVMKALAKDVEDRYQYASELAEDLRSFMYSTGNGYQRKDLAAFMKATFAEDFEKEKARLLEYNSVKAPEGMVAAAELLGFGAGPVPAPGSEAQGSTSSTATPTSMPMHPRPGVANTAPGLPTLARPPTVAATSIAPARVPSATSIPRLTAVAPMLTNGKDEHEATVVGEAAGGQPDEASTSPGVAQHVPGGAPPVPSELTTDPSRPVPALVGAAKVSAPATSPAGGRKPTRGGVPVVPPPPPVPSAEASAPTLSPVAPDGLPTMIGPSPVFAAAASLRPTGPTSAQSEAASRPTRPAAPTATNTPLLLGLAGLLVALIIGVVAVMVFKPGPQGLLMITVPDEVVGQVEVSINGAPLLDAAGQPERSFPALKSVPAGPATVLLKAPGYTAVMETVEVKEGNVPTQLTQALKKKSAEEAPR